MKNKKVLTKEEFLKTRKKSKGGKKYFYLDKKYSVKILSGGVSYSTKNDEYDMVIENGSLFKIECIVYDNYVYNKDIFNS